MSPPTDRDQDHRGALLARIEAARVAAAGSTPPPPLTVEERRATIESLRALIEGLYVHLPQKRASYGFDPVQRLRLLGERAADPDLGDATFHRELAQIFTDLRDAHTRYFGPTESHQQAMVLPLMVERYFDADASVHFVASKVVPLDAAQERAFARERFESGVELTHWNGVPIARAVDLYATRETGGRPHARIARALESLTMRPLRYALPPDEDWVDVRFRPRRGNPREVRIEWERVELSRPDAPPSGPVARSLAYDPIADSAREVKKMLFAGPVWQAEQAAAERPLRSVAENLPAWREDPTDWLTGRFAACVTARVVRDRRRDYGYLRIYSFQVRDDQAFIAEVVELIEQLPAAGLIIDLRANPGGLIWAAEGLLQLFTPHRIRPTRFSLAATDLTRAMVRAAQNRNLAPWAESLADSVASGVSHSRSVPLTTLDRCNNLGQRYAGPVVAVVDANTYSAGDLFAAGFVDNEIGKLVCTDGATGGGGANVWTPRDVAVALAGTGHEVGELLHASFTVAARRAERIGESGIDLEDAGVTSAFRRPLTRRDLLEGNRDLLEYACGLLDAEEVTSLEVATDGPDLVVTVRGLSLVQLEVDGVVTLSVEPDADGTCRMPRPEEWDQHTVEVAGYDRAILRQRRLVTP